MARVVVVFGLCSTSSTFWRSGNNDRRCRAGRVIVIIIIMFLDVAAFALFVGLSFFFSIILRGGFGNALALAGASQVRAIKRRRRCVCFTTICWTWTIHLFSSTRVFVFSSKVTYIRRRRKRMKMKQQLIQYSKDKDIHHQQEEVTKVKTIEKMHWQFVMGHCHRLNLWAGPARPRAPSELFWIGGSFLALARKQVCTQLRVIFLKRLGVPILFESLGVKFGCRYRVKMCSQPKNVSRRHCVGVENSVRPAIQ